MERQWNALERANRVPNLNESPIDFTSSDEEDDENDALYNPTTPEKPQSSRPRRPSRGRKLNPPLPKTRKIVMGLPCPQWQGIFNTNNKGKEKTVEGKGKGKGKVE